LRILRLAEKEMFFTEDAFPDSHGSERLKKTIERPKGSFTKAGLKLEDKEIEAKVRTAYQRFQ